jgi:hypothetical protein
MSKGILWKPEPNLNHYREELLRGFVGQVEYHLFKDNSWIAHLYRNDQEKEQIIADLKKQGYSIDKVCDFKINVISLTNKIEVKLN